MSRQLALQLDARRKEIDEELHNATLTSPLVDDEGFPRADIDIYAIRIARNRIAHLRNDRLAVTEQMAEAMRQAFLEPPGGAGGQSLQNGNHADSSSISSSSVGSSSGSSTVPLKPFARINSVSQGSPADLAGLREGDALVSFAGLSVAASSEAPAPSLTDLPPLVREGQPIEVIVSREEQETVTLELTPRSGPGHRGL
ncbi:putative 26S proteasome regulatory subunit, partial [Tilletia horrida]